MHIDTNTKKIDEVLTRSIADVLPTKEGLKAALQSGKRLRFYIGTDATGASLHLGHATNYMVLERIRQLGHEVIFLIGDFTSRIGDPTERVDSVRKKLGREEVVNNTKSWLDQVRPVIDIKNKENPVRVLYNHDWLSILTFEDLIEIASHFTVQHMIERDMFKKRIQEEKPLYLHELFYPLMQGYDSVAMDVDVEVCGSDQTFNALAGRTLLRKMKNKEKYILVTTLLENPKTGKKMMSKSMGAGVFLDTGAADMYGSLMAQPDENMKQLFIDCTTLLLEEIDKIIDTNKPRDAKMRLAREITTLFHGQDKAEDAELAFIAQFQKGSVPGDIPEVQQPYIEELVRVGIIKSKSELNRLIAAGGIKDAYSGERLQELPELVAEPQTLKIGKRRFVRLLPKNKL